LVAAQQTQHVTPLVTRKPVNTDTYSTSFQITANTCSTSISAVQQEISKHPPPCPSFCQPPSFIQPYCERKCTTAHAKKVLGKKTQQHQTAAGQVTLTLPPGVPACAPVDSSAPSCAPGTSEQRDGSSHACMKGAGGGGRVTFGKRLAEGGQKGGGNFLEGSRTRHS
jgi:hypothetical protein